MTQALSISHRHDAVLAGPVGSLDAYIHSVNSIPMLSETEERDLAVRYRNEEDLDAARQLVLSHLRFVVHIARGYLGYGLQMGDLIQEGNIGLMKAVKRFDPSIGVRLVSFAVHWVRAEIHEFVLRNWRIVKVATTKAQRKLFFNLRKAKRRLGWFSHEEVQTVADELGVSARDVEEMELRLAGHDMGFDGPADADDDEPASFSPSAYLPDDSADPAQLVEAEDTESHGHDSLSDALSGLDARSRDILARRWLNENGKATLQQLAAEYGVSAERIRQLEANALKKLRAALAA